jgi:transposase
MFIKRTVAKRGDKAYVNHLLVESVSTPAGSRHKVVCNLGPLEPGPKEEWLALAERIEAALGGQPSLFADPRVDKAVRLARAREAKEAHASSTSVEVPSSETHTPIPDVVAVKTSGVQIRDIREVGPLHVGHQMWQKLQVDAVLKAVGMGAPARALTEVMTLNRLIQPCSELAMASWTKRVAISDVLGQDVSTLNEDRFYRNLDALHGKRVQIETELHGHEQCLFDLKGTLLLYDLTNIYFEGPVLQTPKAKRGNSKEKRSDCKLVAMGLMLDEDGFPIGHETFAGNTIDGTTVESMLNALETRTGCKGGRTVVMDRGFASAANLALVRERHYDYLVAGFQNQRGGLHDEFEDMEGWEELQPSTMRFPIQIKRIEKSDAAFLLCVSPARAEKDRAIRERQEKRLVADLEKLAVSLDKAQNKPQDKPQNKASNKAQTKHPKQDADVFEKIGRLRERYSRAARYYDIELKDGRLVWNLRAEKRAKAEELDGAYFLKTSRKDMEAQEIWRTYMVLTRVESAFRDLKSTLDVRPVFHRKETRVETHIFLCVLAYHLQVAIERLLHQAGDHTAWETLRQELSTHHIATVLLPTADGRTLAIRRASIPETRPREIYRHLGITGEPMKPIRTWV